MFTLNLALMNPTPTLAAALKWVSSTTSIDLDAGAALADLLGVDDECPDLVTGRLDRNGAFEMHGSSRALIGSVVHR